MLVCSREAYANTEKSILLESVNLFIISISTPNAFVNLHRNSYFENDICFLHLHSFLYHMWCVRSGSASIYINVLLNNLATIRIHKKMFKICINQYFAV